MLCSLCEPDALGRLQVVLQVASLLAKYHSWLPLQSLKACHLERRLCSVLVMRRNGEEGLNIAGCASQPREAELVSVIISRTDLLHIMVDGIIA
jgi:hypothetical protein